MTDDRTIYERMIDILGALPAIGKNQRNTQQGFSFRGIDDAVNALNPLLHEHGVFFVPNCLDRIEEKRETRGGSVMHVVHLHIQFTFYGRKGDSVTASMWGEGSDSGDKSTSKASSMAEKYALVQAFCIATEEVAKNDPDASTPPETVSGTQVVQDRLAALSDPDKARLRERWKSSGLPAPARLRGAQVKEAMRMLDELADEGRPFDEGAGSAGGEPATDGEGDDGGTAIPSASRGDAATTSASDGTQLTPSDPPTPTMTGAQNRKLFAVLKPFNFADDEVRHAWASEVLGREVTTFATLSSDDANRLIDAADKKPVKA